MSIENKFREHGQPISPDAMKTKALADTLKIVDPRDKAKTVKHINELGKFMIEELKMQDWMKNDDMACLASTIVSVSPPQI